ncbi:MAG: hypothetical protein Q8880_10265 [Bacteroidota bacterium]|nr:hypothetical protein [Bacteroidota bacterium]
MRHNYIFVAIFILLAVSCHDKKEFKEERDKIKFFGIKSCTTFDYDSNSSKKDTNRTKEEKKVYDINGNIIEDIFYNTDGSVYNRNVFFYNKDQNETEHVIYNSMGNIINTISTTYDDNGNKIEVNNYGLNKKIEYQEKNRYDKKNHRIESMIYNSDGTVNLTSSKYDNKGLEIENIEYKSDGSIDTRYVYNYDINRRLIESISYNQDGDIQNDIVYKYDKNGNEISNVNYDKTKRIAMSVETSYDSKGRVIQIITKNEDGSIEKENTKYDSDSNPTEKITFKNNVESSKLIFKYNNKGLLIETVEVSPQDKTENRRKFEYSFYNSKK